MLPLQSIAEWSLAVPKGLCTQKILGNRRCRFLSFLIYFWIVVWIVVWVGTETLVYSRVLFLVLVMIWKSKAAAHMSNYLYLTPSSRYPTCIVDRGCQSGNKYTALGERAAAHLQI